MKCPVCGKDVEPFVLDTGSPVTAKRIMLTPEIHVEFAPRVKLRACPECGVIRLNLEEPPRDKSRDNMS